MSFDAAIDTVALVITSCGRIDLLDSTIDSFVVHNTYKLSQCVIVEDSGYLLDRTRIAKKLNLAESDVLILVNQTNIGQIASIDLAYSHVRTKFIFHCEDDWSFYAPGFIEASLSILASEKKVISVWIRSLKDLNGHPIEEEAHTTSDGVAKYFRLKRRWRGVWSGFTFNPSLRRTEDAKLLGPYQDLPLVTPGLGKRRRVTESDVSIAYDAKGFYGVVIASPRGYVSHSGEDRHIASEWERPIYLLLRKLWRRIRRLKINN